MNNQRLSIILIPCILILATVLATTSIFTGGGNQLGGVFILVIVASSIIGFFSPKGALLLFVVVQFYVDFFKRLLILGDSLAKEDIMVSLGLGPMLVIVSCISCTLRCVNSQIPFSFRRDFPFCCGCIGVSLLGTVLGRSGMGASGETRSFVEVGQAVLGSGMLGMSAFACYLLLRDPEDRYKTLRWLTIGGIPMALYTIYQATFGFSVWEENYIKTGLSMILYSAYVSAGGIEAMRPFSTLNTHVSVGAASATLLMISLLIMRRSRAFFPGQLRLTWVYVPIALIYFGSCLLCQNRTTYFLPIFALLAFWFFSGGIRTVVFYLSGISAFIVLVINSGWINDEILYWSSIFESTAFGKQFGTLGTYQDRLKGMIALSEGRNWTPFGLPASEQPFFHDQITEVVVRLGYIPLLIGLIALFSCVGWWHRRCLRAQDPMTRKFLISLTAIIASLGICGIAYGNMLFVAPVNSILGILLGLGMVTIRQTRRSEGAALNPTKSPQLEELTRPFKQRAVH